MNSRTRPIVVGLDLSEPSVAAARWTARHLVGDGPLVLVHVVSVYEPPGFLRGLLPPTEQLLEDARRGAEERLGALGRSLGGPSVRTEVRVGRPDEQLVEAAGAAGAALLVVGPHAERPGLGKLLGSTAERVARRSATSLLLARSLPPGPPRRVLVALDGGDFAGVLLGWGAWCVRRFGAELVALHVIPAMLHGAVRIAASGREAGRAEEQLRLRAATWLRERVAATPHAGGAAWHVALGDAGLEILSAARRYEADLIVIGRHGGAGRGGGFLGSVAEFLLRSGSGPVLAAVEPPDVPDA